MRKTIQAALVAAAGSGLVFGVASAAERDTVSPEAKAYLHFSFGGDRSAAASALRGFHYGLRLDHDSRFAAPETAPLMQLDFTATGLDQARLNGLSVLKRQYRLRQAEEAAEEEAAEEEVVEEEGFFESMFSGVASFFGGLFGDDEEEAAAESAQAEEALSEEELAEQQMAEEAAPTTLTDYTAVDWGVLAVGAVSLGFIASEISNGDDDPDPPAGSGTPPPCTPQPICGLTLRDHWGYGGDLERDLERERWLNSGTGQMGDLGG